MTNKESTFVSTTSAETNLLGIIINKPSLLYEINPSLTEEMFSVDAHRIIYRTMISLMEDNYNPTKKLIKDYLQSAGLLESVGGEEYLDYLENEISGNEVEQGNIKKYSEIINKSFKSREALKIGEYVKRLEDNQDVVDIVLDDIRDRLNYIEEKGHKSNTSKISSFLKDVWNSIKEKVKNPGITGRTTGYNSIDSITGGVSGGDYWIVGGRPSHGKTSLMLNSTLRTARKGNPVLIFSLEMNEYSITERFLSLISGVDHLKIRLGTMNKQEVKMIRKALQELKELPIYLSTLYELSASEISATIKEYVKTKDVKIVWIDYIQLTTDRENQAVHAIGQISRMCKLLANDLNIFIGVVSQLNRQVEQRENKRPMKSDLRQSGNLEEDADLIMFTYRDELYNEDAKEGEMELIIDKHRNGPIGRHFMKFEKNTMKIKDT